MDGSEAVLVDPQLFDGGHVEAMQSLDGLHFSACDGEGFDCSELDGSELLQVGVWVGSGLL